jgi:hypothetical protein
MTPPLTLSLASSKLLAPYVVEETMFTWHKWDVPDEWELREAWLCKDDDCIPAPTLSDLLPILKQVGEKKGWKDTCSRCGISEEYGCCEYPKIVDTWQYHFLTICHLYAETGNLSSAEDYLIKLLK